MRKREPKVDLDLTDDEIAVLRSASSPNEVKEFIARSHQTVGARITAYQKIAAAARAERLALQEIRRLHETREVVTEQSEYRQRISALEAEKADLLNSHEQLRRQLAQTTAMPALAVHSDD